MGTFMTMAGVRAAIAVERIAGSIGRLIFVDGLGGTFPALRCRHDGMSLL
jgi:hypothetical protein